MLLEEMTTDEVKKHLTTDPLIVIPVGATEQHGLANPMGTDFLIVRHIAKNACDRANAICAPTMPIGLSEPHSKFAGTIWLPPRLFVELMKEYSFSLASHGFDHFIFLNGHRGNSPALEEVTQVLFFKHKFQATAFDWWKFLDWEQIRKLFPGSTFGNIEAIEIAINLAIHPHLVHEEKLPRIQAPPKEGKRVHDISLPVESEELASDSVMRSLEGISEKAGKVVLETIISRFAEFINDYREF